MRSISESIKEFKMKESAPVKIVFDGKNAGKILVALKNAKVKADVEKNGKLWINKEDNVVFKDDTVTISGNVATITKPKYVESEDDGELNPLLKPEEKPKKVQINQSEGFIPMSKVKPETLVKEEKDLYDAITAMKINKKITEINLTTSSFKVEFSSGVEVIFTLGGENLYFSFTDNSMFVKGGVDDTLKAMSLFLKEVANYGGKASVKLE